MRNITGSPVDGENFFGREEELGRLRRALEAGNHVLLLGPRRVGKSSLVAEIGRILSDDGWSIITLDVQHVTDEVAFLQELLEAIKFSGVTLPVLTHIEGAIAAFRRVFRGAKVKGAGVEIDIGDEAADWETAAGTLRRLIPTLAGHEQRVVIAIDELPVFLSKLLTESDGLERVRRMLDWLRSVRQACGTSLPWLLCGSIGLDSFVDRHSLSGTINELQPQTVGAFDEATALQCLHRLAESEPYALQMTDEVAREMIQRVGWPIPYYLQLLFHALAELPSSQRSQAYPAVADVEAAYQTLLDPHHHGHFSHWDSRLGDLLNPDELDRARLVLNHLCTLPEGSELSVLLNLLERETTPATPRALDRELRDLLALLERDGYLIRTGNTFAFRSFLLRDYWKRQFV